MRGVSLQAKNVGAEGEEAEGDGGGEGAGFIKQEASDQIDEGDGGEVDEEESEVDARGGLAEHGHDDGIGGVGAGEFHVEHLAVRRHALQDELAGVGVFALVALQRHVEQAQTHGDHQKGEQPEGEDASESGVHDPKD
jgi:hypothetical protein